MWLSTLALAAVVLVIIGVVLVVVNDRNRIAITAGHNVSHGCHIGVTYALCMNDLMHQLLAVPLVCVMR